MIHPRAVWQQVFEAVTKFLQGLSSSLLCLRVPIELVFNCNHGLLFKMLVKHAFPGRVQLEVSHHGLLALILLFEALLRTQGLLGWHMDVEEEVAVETLSVILLLLEHPYDLVVFDMLCLSFCLLL